MNFIAAEPGWQSLARLRIVVVFRHIGLVVVAVHGIQIDIPRPVVFGDAYSRFLDTRRQAIAYQAHYLDIRIAFAQQAYQFDISRAERRVVQSLDLGSRNGRLSLAEHLGERLVRRSIGTLDIHPGSKRVCVMSAIVRSAHG